MIGKATELNERIKNAFVGPFWNTISPDNSLRLFVELLKKIDLPSIDKENSGFPPARIIFGTSHKLYRKIKKKRNLIIYQIKNDLIHLYTSCGYEFDKLEIDFIQLSYLKDNEIKVITHKENRLNIHNRKYFLRILNGSEDMWMLRKPGEYFIGRDRNSFIRIDNPYVSLQQAKINLSDRGMVTIADCGSTNKTYINNNGEPLTENAAISNGDKVFFGRKRKIGIQLLLIRT